MQSYPRFLLPDGIKRQKHLHITPINHYNSHLKKRNGNSGLLEGNSGSTEGNSAGAEMHSCLFLIPVQYHIHDSGIRFNYFPSKDAPQHKKRKKIFCSALGFHYLYIRKDAPRHKKEKNFFYSALGFHYLYIRKDAPRHKKEKIFFCSALGFHYLCSRKGADDCHYPKQTYLLNSKQIITQWKI